MKTTHFSLISLFIFSGLMHSCNGNTPAGSSPSNPAAETPAAAEPAKASCAQPNDFALRVEVSKSSPASMMESGDKGPVTMNVEHFQPLHSSVETKSEKALVIRIQNYAGEKGLSELSGDDVQLVLRLDAAEAGQTGPGVYEFGDFRLPKRANLTVITAGHLVDPAYVNGEPSYGTLTVEKMDKENFCATVDMNFEKAGEGSVSLKGVISLAPDTRLMQ